MAESSLENGEKYFGKIPVPSAKVRGLMRAPTPFELQIKCHKFRFQKPLSNLSSTNNEVEKGDLSPRPRYRGRVQIYNYREKLKISRSLVPPRAVGLPAFMTSTKLIEGCIISLSVAAKFVPSLTKIGLTFGKGVRGGESRGGFTFTHKHLSASKTRA